MEELYPNLVPPQNIEAEEAVLGSILLASDSIISVMEFLTPEDFYRVSHQLIFAAMIELNQNNIDIDAITVSEILRQKNQMENIGGEVTLIELLDKVPTAANVEYYTQIVLEKSTRRKFELAAPILALGYTRVPVKLHHDVTAIMTVNIVAQ